MLLQSVGDRQALLDKKKELCTLHVDSSGVLSTHGLDLDHSADAINHPSCLMREKEPLWT